MAKKKEEVIEEIIEKISVEPLEDVMGDRYATYAKYVIQDRAIPDVRDGLKPVQRRIIYAMYKDGNIFTRPTRKCAHTVGAVMGTYHPHGDSSIYEALVRMSQTWKVNNPLIDFQGNNGSIDGDGPAAYRYTEARLSQIAEEMIRDIDKDTVDMSLTFDDENFEPVVVPSRFPNLLVNGEKVPSRDEWEALIDGLTWAPIVVDRGIKGMLGVDKDGKYIFLQNGHYWTSTLFDETSAFCVQVESGDPVDKLAIIFADPTAPLAVRSMAGPTDPILNTFNPEITY